MDLRHREAPIFERAGLRELIQVSSSVLKSITNTCGNQYSGAIRI